MLKEKDKENKRCKNQKKKEKLTKIRDLETVIEEENLKLKVADTLISEKLSSLTLGKQGKGKVDKSLVMKAS